MKRLVEWVRLNGSGLIWNCIYFGFYAITVKVLNGQGQLIQPMFGHVLIVLSYTALCSFVVLYALDSLIEFFRAIASFNRVTAKLEKHRLMRYVVNFSRFLIIAGIYNFLDMPDTDSSGAILVVSTFSFVLGLAAYHQYIKELLESNPSKAE